MKKFLTLIALLMAFAANGFADTWTVAGSAAALNGDAGWAQTNTDNDMTGSDGVYTLEVTNCTLEEGVPYEFKVVKNHSWDEAYPSSNKTFTVSETAVYTVTYTFNSETKEVGVSTTKTGEAGAITHTYTVAGAPAALFGTAWAPTETANDMVETSEGSGIYTWTKENVELDGNTIEFKICEDHAWSVAFPANNYVVSTRDGYDGAGYYNVTITFTEGTRAITAEFEELAPATISTVAISAINPLTHEIVYSAELTGSGPFEKDNIDLSSVTTDIPFQFSVNGAAVDPSAIKYEGGLLEEGSGFTAGYILFKHASSGFITYKATATWDENPSATANWTLKVEGQDKRLYIIQSDGSDWTKASEMAFSEGVYSASLTGYEGKYFAIAPADALSAAGAVTDWSKVICPITEGADWEIKYFHNYNGQTHSSAVESERKVWYVLEGESSTLTLTYNSTSAGFTITSDASTTASIGDAGWATYSLENPYKISGTDLEVYIVKSVENGANGEAKLTQLAEGTEIPARTGILLKGSKGSYTVTPSLGNGDVAGNMLIGSCDNNYVITGYDESYGSYTPYIFMNDPTEGIGFFKLDVTTANEAEKTLAPHKAFLAASAGLTAPFLAIDGEATGIQNIERTLNDGLFYDLSGRRVENPTKGLYIHNGKKVVIK